MQLYFLRHAHAEEGIGISDHDRKLTDKGLLAANSVARLLEALDVKPNHIYTSPRVRARQTAEIVAAGLGREVEIREEVNFSFSVAALRGLIKGMSPSSSVLLVGHEPTFSLTIGEITGARVAMRKCGLARVDLLSRPTPPTSKQALEPLRGELVWLVPPRVFTAFDED